MFLGTGRGLEYFLSVLSADIWGGALCGRMGEPEGWLEGRVRKIVTRYDLGQVDNSRAVTCLCGQAWAESSQGSRTLLWMLQENKHWWQTQWLNPAQVVGEKGNKQQVQVWAGGCLYEPTWKARNKITDTSCIAPVDMLCAHTVMWCGFSSHSNQAQTKILTPLFQKDRRKNRRSKRRKLTGQDKDRLTSEGKRKNKWCRGSHSSSPSQCFWATAILEAKPLSILLHLSQVLWLSMKLYGISLWVVGISCLSCVPSQILSHPQPASWRGGGRQSGKESQLWHCVSTAQQWAQQWCVISTAVSTNPKHSTTQRKLTSSWPDPQQYDIVLNSMTLGVKSN